MPVSVRPGCLVEIKRPYLEVERAGLGSVLVLLAGALLEEAVDLCRGWYGQLCRGWCCVPRECSYLEELIVGGGLREAAAVLDGLLELGGLGDHVCDLFV